MSKSLIDLPSNVLVEILARLPLRTLFAARSVCKTFASLTTPDPHFLNLHSSTAAQILVFQFGQFGGLRIPSYLLRLADQDHDYENSQLKPLFQLPKLDTVPLSRRVYWQPFSYFLVNSCNGLVYLWQHGPVDDERSLVCNPVTNEYVLIPEVDLEIRLASVTRSMWLGFSPATDQYKLLRIFCWRRNTDEVLAQVSVIGSNSWRYIDATQLWRPHLYRNFPEAFVDGVMYWHDPSWPDLFSFDFELEKFGEVALPPEFQREHYSSIGVLRGCLCLTCNLLDGHHVDLWVMRKCGSWRKEFVVDLYGPVDHHFRPLQFLPSGEILMLLPGYGMVCYDPRSNTLRSSELKMSLRVGYRAVTLTPSFVPLKDTLKVEEVLSELRPRGDEKEEL